MKRLRDNLTSSYFEAANRLQSKRARKKVVAYVESYDDVFFWRQILSQFESDTLYFEIMLPSRMQHLERGKKAVLMRLLSGKTGQSMIACVDADYDYLIQGKTETSRAVISNPYVFHTYAYAIENMQCYAPSLHEVCVAVTLNDHNIFDMEEYLRQYSRAIYPLFVWNIWYYRTPHYSEFTLTALRRSSRSTAASRPTTPTCISRAITSSTRSSCRCSARSATNSSDNGRARSPAKAFTAPNAATSSHAIPTVWPTSPPCSRKTPASCAHHNIIR